MASTIGTSLLTPILRPQMKFSSPSVAREIIWIEMGRVLGRNPGIWLWKPQACSLTEVFIQNSLILRRRPAFLPTTELSVIRTATWCLQASLSTTRRRVMPLVIRAMCRSILRTLAKWLGSVTIRQGGSAPAARFSRVSASTSGQISQHSRKASIWGSMTTVCTATLKSRLISKKSTRIGFGL